jgi:hypothetical protein
MAFKIPYVYDCITKLCRSQAEVILTHVNPNVSGIQQEEARHRKYKKLSLGGSQAVQLTNHSFRVLSQVKA